MPEPVTQPDDSGGQNARQFTDTPQGNAARIRREFEAFDKWSKDWREREAPETIRLFLDKRGASDQGEKVNLFTSNNIMTCDPKLVLNRFRRHSAIGDELFVASCMAEMRRSESLNSYGMFQPRGPNCGRGRGAIVAGQGRERARVVS